MEPIKLGIVGTDSYVNDVLRSFVKQIEKKPRTFDPIRFYIIPVGKEYECCIGDVLANIDPTFSELFYTEEWTERFEKSNRDDEWTVEMGITIERRIQDYILGANMVLEMPIAEVMITYPDAVLGGQPISTPPHSSATNRKEG